MNTLSGNGLTIGQSLTPNYAMKIRPGKGGSPGQPYEPPKEDPNNPYVPAKPRPKLAMDDPLADYDVTDKGLYMHYSGDMFMNLDGMLFPMGQGYDEETHGKFVPKGLVQSMQINPDIARDFTYDAEPGGVVTPRYFTPPQMRDEAIKTPDIKKQELFHFNNFIRSLGPGFDKVQKLTPMSIASHDNRQFKSVPARGARGDTPASKEYIDGMLQRNIKPSTPNNLFGLT